MSAAHFASAVVIAVAAMLVPPSAGAAQNGPGQDAHYFLMTAEASGSFAADYGDERLAPGQTTSFGVDGVESGSWTWKIRAVGRSVGNGALKSAAAQYSGYASHSAEIISYTIQMGQLGEDNLCDGQDTVATSTFTISSDPKQDLPAWVPGAGAAIQFRASGLAIGYPSYYSLVYDSCFHSMPDAGLYENILPSDAPVPRGAFNPRSDRSYSDTWTRSVNEPSHGDTASRHSETASATLTVTVKAVSERKAKRKRDRYRDTPRGNVAGTFE